MLPKNPLGRAMYLKLKVFAGDKHPHAAQQARQAAHEARWRGGDVQPAQRRIAVVVERPQTVVETIQAGGEEQGARVLDHVVGRLDDDVAAIVVTFSTRASGDLAKVAHAENRGLLAVVFPELGEEDGADRDVDADAEGVGAADDFEQAAGGEFFD